jgi:hypothetical protein
VAILTGLVVGAMTERRCGYRWSWGVGPFVGVLVVRFRIRVIFFWRALAWSPCGRNEQDAGCVTRP